MAENNPPDRPRSEVHAVSGELPGCSQPFRSRLSSTRSPTSRAPRQSSRVDARSGRLHYTSLKFGGFRDRLHAPQRPPNFRLQHVPRKSKALVADTTGASKKDILELTDKFNVSFMRLQFTDILGVNKNVEIPSSQFDKALDGDIMFDGSSIEGFVRIEESDMLLKPDFDTFRVFPWGDADNRICRLICDINRPDGTSFAGDPRTVLRQGIARASSLGYTMNAGMEAEFFLFRPAADGAPSTTTHDVG